MGTSPKPLQNDDRLHLLSEKTKSRSKWLHLPGRLCFVWFSLLWDWFLTPLKAKLGNTARPPGGTLLTRPRQLTGRLQRMAPGIDKTEVAQQMGVGSLPKLFLRCCVMRLEPPQGPVASVFPLLWLSCLDRPAWGSTWDCPTHNINAPIFPQSTV